MSDDEEVTNLNAASPKLPEPILDLDKIEVVSQAQKGAADILADFKSNLADAIKIPDAFAETMKSIGRLNLDKMLQMPDYSHNVELVALPPNPAYETNRLLKEVSSKLDNLSEQNAKLVAPHFYPDNCEIIFANKRINIPRNTNQAQLCNALFSEPEKEWDWSEMLEAWGYDETAYKKDDWRKVYNTAREVNTKVAIETSVKDLLTVTQKTVQINPNYLAQIS